MDLNKRKDFVFIILAGFFVTNTIVAELIGGKLVQFFGLFTQSIGIILWPFVFLLTDIINENYGKQGVRRLTYITVGLIIYTYVLITIGMNIESTTFSPVSTSNFNAVFGQSRWIIIGSIFAFLLSQLVDVYIFWLFRKKTGGKLIWLRATGSTMVSQLIDTFVVQFIGFVLPGKWAFDEFIKNAAWGYTFKLLVALCLIPLIYAGHNAVKRYIDNEPGKTNLQNK